MKVTLKHDHTHAGKKYLAGETIPDVSLIDALWMKAEDVVEEGIDLFKAEVRKLDGKDAQAAHAGALNKAVTADATRNQTAGNAEPSPPPANVTPIKS